jgi:hypothetical protein
MFVLQVKASVQSWAVTWHTDWTLSLVGAPNISGAPGNQKRLADDRRAAEKRMGR